MAGTGGIDEVGEAGGIQATLDRFAVPALVVGLVGAFAHLVWIGRDEWFSYGDWALFDGPATDDLLRPVEQHWTTVPLLLYRGLFALFGLEFMPYLVVAVVLHLAIAASIWVAMRCSGVRAWVATMVTAPMVLFAPGYLSIVVANARFDPSDRPLHPSGAYYNHTRGILVAAARDPGLDAEAREDPDGLAIVDQPFSGLQSLTNAWLLELRDSGRLPDG
jgi:hypothetical protein